MRTETPNAPGTATGNLPIRRPGAGRARRWKVLLYAANRAAQVGALEQEVEVAGRSDLAALCPASAGQVSGDHPQVSVDEVRAL
jgi:hypothetical protein